MTCFGLIVLSIVVSVAADKIAGAIRSLKNGE